MSLYKRIDQMSEKIDHTMKLKESFHQLPKAPEDELFEREKRALSRLLEIISPNLEEICDVLKLGKQYIDEFDLSEIPPSISETGFRGIALMENINKNEEENFIIALLANGEFQKMTCSYNTHLKAYEKFKFSDFDMEDIIKMVPCQEIFDAIEKDIKSFEKRVKENKPSHLKRQEFLAKIGG
jgi:hypothetical protein